VVGTFCGSIAGEHTSFFGSSANLEVDAGGADFSGLADDFEGVAFDRAGGGAVCVACGSTGFAPGLAEGAVVEGGGGVE
jgi:hypothetical protein